MVFYFSCVRSALYDWFCNDNVWGLDCFGCFWLFLVYLCDLYQCLFIGVRLTWFDLIGSVGLNLLFLLVSRLTDLIDHWLVLFISIVFVWIESRHGLFWLVLTACKVNLLFVFGSSLKKWLVLIYLTVFEFNLLFMLLTSLFDSFCDCHCPILSGF